MKENQTQLPRLNVPAKFVTTPVRIVNLPYSTVTLHSIHSRRYTFRVTSLGLRPEVKSSFAHMMDGCTNSLSAQSRIIWYQSASEMGIFDVWIMPVCQEGCHGVTWLNTPSEPEREVSAAHAQPTDRAMKASDVSESYPGYKDIRRIGIVSRL